MIVNILLGIAGLLVVFLVAFALLDATRGTPVSYVSARGEETAPAVRDPIFHRTVEAQVSVALRPGHRIELLGCGDELYPCLWEDLSRAQRFIAFQMYYFNPGAVANRLRDVLTERARAGVEVLFLYDAFGATMEADYAESLRAAGVEVAKFRAFRPHQLHTMIHRAHVRAIVIDGEIGYTGGFGIDDKWLGDGRREAHWRDTNVRFTGPAVTQLLAVFTSCWAEATEELIAGRRYWGAWDAEPEEREGELAKVFAGVLHAKPEVGSTAAERLVALTLASARERLWITNAYFVPDDDFRRLVKDAVTRGADVRVLVAGKHNDVKTTYYGARARYEELLGAGVRIWEYQPSMIHAKTMVADGVWSIVGTMNLDNRSMAFNNECNLLAMDEGLAAALERMFLADLEYAHEVDLETFRQRPLWQRPIELGAHLLSRIL